MKIDKFRGPADQDEEDEFRDFENFEPQQIAYYESPRILGKLYRAINEHKFLNDLQKQADELSSQPDHAMIGRVWNYVRRECMLIQWEHLLPVARDIKEW